MNGLTGRDRQINTFVIALIALPGMGARTVQKILDEHGTEILEAAVLDGEFARSLNETKLTKALDGDGVEWDYYEEFADSIIERANRSDVSILNPLMAAYPKRLLLNKKYPPVLYCIGDTEVLNEKKAVAIIGTREPTDFGKRMGHRLAELLVEDGYVIVSGLAIGCDTVGHEGALDAGGKTIAVLPTPIDAPVYPKQNQALADRIVDTGGVLVSEYAPGVELHDKQLVSNLVARDEWQPGLSDGLICIETSVNGGSNHALRHAQNTDTPIAVFDYSSRDAANFNSDERFGGNVHYLQNGAMPIYEAATVDAFKQAMDKYRLQHDPAESGAGNGNDTGETQMTLCFD